MENIEKMAWVQYIVSKLPEPYRQVTDQVMRQDAGLYGVRRRFLHQKDTATAVEARSGLQLD